MIWRIARHEIRLLSADRTLALVLALFLAAFGYAAWNGRAYRGSQVDERQRAQAAWEEKLASLRRELEKPPQPVEDRFAPNPRSPRFVGGQNEDVFLPLSPLSGMAVGQSDLLPDRVGASVWTSRRSLTHDYEVQNPQNLLAGRFDLAFVVVVLFPLVILALSYNLLSQEREQGTLTLTLSQPIHLRTLVLGKVGARFLLVVAVAGGLSIAGALVSGSSIATPDAAARLVLWTLVVVLYGAFWFAVAVFVSARGKGSAANALAVSSLWLGLVIVIPALVNLSVSTLYPTPSRTLLLGSMREASNSASQRAAELLAEYFQDHPELLPPGRDPDQRDFMTRFLVTEDNIDASVAPLLEQHEEALAKQHALLRRISLVSPAIVAEEVLIGIAGTGYERHHRFLSQSWAFVRRKKDFFIPKIMRDERLTEADYDAVPRFTFVDEELAELAQRPAPGLLALALSAGALLAVGLRGLRRYPITG